MSFLSKTLFTRGLLFSWLLYFCLPCSFNNWPLTLLYPALNYHRLCRIYGVIAKNSKGFVINTSPSPGIEGKGKIHLLAHLQVRFLQGKNQTITIGDNFPDIQCSSPFIAQGNHFGNRAVCLYSV